MTLGADVAFLGLLLENTDLLATAEFLDLEFDTGAGHEGLADLGLGALGTEEDTVGLHLVAHLVVLEFLDGEDIPFLDFVLASSDFDNGKHRIEIIECD